VTIAGVRRWAGVDDAARLRDALGTPIPHGVPSAFLEPVPDPIGDLVGRFARTHGPFAASDVAAHFGLGIAVVVDALRRLAADRRLVEGEFRPGAAGTEWVDAEVLRRLRSRSLAALRREIEPVSHGALGRFLSTWQHVGSAASREPVVEALAPVTVGRAARERPGLSGVDGVLQAIEQLQGLALPATAWESLVLPSRVRDYSPAMLDELCAAGDVLWAGAGELPGSDGWVALHLAETVHLSLPEPIDIELNDRQRAVLDALAGGGGFFFRQLATAVQQSTGESIADADLVDDLWGLVWAGAVGNDTFAPLRARLGGSSSRTAGRRAPTRPRAYRGYARPTSALQAGPPTVAGRWSLLPERDLDPTRRAAFAVDALLERHGIVTRGAVQAEGLRGGFALAYQVLSRREEAGSVRRGYIVEGLGAAQFAHPSTVDRVRTFSRDADAAPALTAIVLAATDPANPYGAALPWPAPASDVTHRPGRKAGALVALVDGHLAVYLERGGKSALVYTDDAAVLEAAAVELAAVVRARLRSVRVERVDGASAIGTPLGDALVAAGFVVTPQGLRLRL